MKIMKISVSRLRKMKQEGSRIVMLTAYDAAIGYYERGAVLPIIQKALIIISTLLIIFVTLKIKKGEAASGAPAQSQLTVFSSFLCGTLQFCSAILILLFQREKIETVTLMIILGFGFATAYFFYDALCPRERKSPLCILPAMAAIIGLVAVIVRVHIDYTVTLNSPNKNLIFVAFAAIALFIVQELRFIVDRPQPRLYIVSASIALLLCASLSIPGIIGHYTNILSGGDFLIYYMVTFGYAVYIAIRLCTYIKYCTFTASISDQESATCIEEPDEDQERTGA